MYGDWTPVFHHEMSQSYFAQLEQFLTIERCNYEIFPPQDHIFTACTLTSLAETKVVIVGQDPYHGLGQAHGLAFSVSNGMGIPPSLRNIFTELVTDLNIAPPTSGDLTHWAQQGVLLLNTTLTVRSGAALSHRGHGWEQFTDALITAVNNRSTPCVFVLWGSHAQLKRHLVTNTMHRIITSPHPSPLSAHRGFFGSRPFSTTNGILIELGHDPIDWALP